MINAQQLNRYHARKKRELRRTEFSLLRFAGENSFARPDLVKPRDIM